MRLPRLRLFWHRLAALAVMASLFAIASPARAIELSLNLIYSMNSDPNTWEIVAKGDSSGIAALNLWVDGLETVQSTAPKGTVNGGDRAGFGFFETAIYNGHRNIALGQAPINLGPGEEQSLFYGVGTLSPGSPDYAGKPPGSISIGPVFTSLTGVSNVPWANTPDVFGDAAWDSAAKLLTGTFADGVTPAFFSGPGQTSSGTVFSTVGTSTSPGTISAASFEDPIVRSNLVVTGADADYNDDGFVNAADYTVWRNLLGQSGPGLAADAAGPGTPGVPDGMVDRNDYDFWVANFGLPVPGGGSGAISGGGTVPEPAGVCLGLIGAAFGLLRGRFRRANRVR